MPSPRLRSHSRIYARLRPPRTSSPVTQSCSREQNPSWRRMPWTWILAQKTYLAAHSAHPDGQPNPEYAQASKPRFAQWVIDMCTRERDQAWLDYQYLIGARHMTAAKNAADGADSTPFVPLRYVLAFIAPTVEVGHRLLAEGFEGAELDAVRDAWTRAVTVAVTVWAYAYRDHPEQF